jgi:hypothetical protein
MAATARRVVGPNTRDWYASGCLIVWGPIEGIGLVTPPGYAPTALVPDWLVGGAALDRAIGSLIPELRREAYGEGHLLYQMRAVVAKLRAAVPAVLSGLAGAKLLHICAWDGLTSAIEALLALPDYFVS